MKKVSIYGIMILISVSPLFRGLLFKYETYAFLGAVSLLAFLYFAGKVRNDEPIHINKLFTALGILLIAASALSFVSAANPRENLGSLLMYATFGIVFTVLYDYFYNERQQLIKTIMLLTTATGLVCAVVGMEALTGSYHFLDVTLFAGRLGSTFQYTNTAAIYFSICFLFAMTLTATLKNQVLKGLIAGAGNLFIFALFLTGSRGGYITAMAAILLFLLIQPSGCRLKGITNVAAMLLPLAITFNRFSSSAAAKDYTASTVWMAVSFVTAMALYYIFYLAGALISKSVFKGRPPEAPKHSGIIFAAAFIAVIAVAVVFRRQFFSLLPAVLSTRLEKMNLNDPNILYRLQFDKDALKLIAGNWLTGLGGGGWLARYQSVQDVFYTANFTHNNFLQIFVETGILGFLAYMAMVLTALIRGAVSYFKEKESTLRVYTAGLLCSFIALAFHSSFDFDLTYVSLALLLWMMFAALTAAPQPGQNGQRTIAYSNRLLKAVPVIICAVLISAYALFFTAAYNSNTAKQFARDGDYRTAVVYYEEAKRLDSANSDYLFELSKIYCYFAETSKKEDIKSQWFQRALSAGERGIELNRYYPPQLKTLIQICRDMNTPENYIGYSKELIKAQSSNIANYELLAECYLDAAKYYKARGDTETEKKMLTECIALQDNPFFKNAKEGKGFDMLKMKLDSGNKQSGKLNEYFKEAETILQTDG